MARRQYGGRERRWYPRIEKGILVSIDHKALGKDHEFMTHDISMGGLCLWVPISQERYWLAFSVVDGDVLVYLTTKDGKRIRLKGHIAWANRDMGRAGIELHQKNNPTVKSLVNS